MISGKVAGAARIGLSADADPIELGRQLLRRTGEGPEVAIVQVGAKTTGPRSSDRGWGRVRNWGGGFGGGTKTRSWDGHLRKAAALALEAPVDDGVFVNNAGPWWKRLHLPG